MVMYISHHHQITPDSALALLVTLGVVVVRWCSVDIDASQVSSLTLPPAGLQVPLSISAGSDRSVALLDGAAHTIAAPFRAALTLLFRRE